MLTTTSSNFASTGLITIPSECTNTACTNRTLSIKGTLSQPVSLHPRLSPPPQGITTANCASASRSPSWTISNIRHQQNMSMSVNFAFSFLNRWGSLDFDLRNHANDVAIHCHVEGEELTNYPALPLTQDTLRYDKWWSCDAVNQTLFPAADGFPVRNDISTSVQFDRRSGVLVVSQSWYCAGDDGRSL